MPKQPDTLWVDVSDSYSLIDFAVRTRLLRMFDSYKKASVAWFGTDNDATLQEFYRTLDGLSRSAVKRS